MDWEAVCQVPVDLRTEIGVGMSGDQKMVWVELSKAAWDKGVLPEDCFDKDQVLIPDTVHPKLWPLLNLVVS